MTKPGWGAVVQGETHGLEGWEQALKEQFNPWIEKHGNEFVLRSNQLDELSTAPEVRDLAVAHIARLNGAMALAHRTRPIRFGGAVEITPDGGLHRTIFVEAAIEEEDDFLRATATVIGLDGNPVLPQPKPSEVQTWTELAERDELLNEALIYFGRATDWFDIYKTLECLMMRSGTEESFLSLGWAPAAEISRLKRTANSARHAKRKFEPPPNPMDLKDAGALLGQLLRRALSEA